MSEIVPSTKLRMVSTHKLGDTLCWRKFFWRRVLNLESRNLNESYWYGSVLGEGFEAMLKDENWCRIIQKKDEEIRKEYVLNDMQQRELDLQFRLIESSLERAECLPIVQRMKLDKTQVKFVIPLKCGVKFCGTLDGIGTFDGRPHMYEFKTAKQLKKNYKKVLLFDKQINGYAWARMKKGDEPLGRCRYCIFKKCNRRMGKKTLGQFVEQWQEDLRDPSREEYIWESIVLGRQTVEEAGKDIEQEAEDLLVKFEQGEKQGRLLEPDFWPKRDTRCLEYSGCEFMPLCENPKKWKIFLRSYKQRRMLYKEEKTELESNHGD